MSAKKLYFRFTEKEIQEKFKEPQPMTIFTWQGEQEVSMSPLDSVKHYLYYLNAGFLAMDPDDGAILAWVGGINHKYFKYDHVNIRTKRQVGSVFKPIVYAAGLENGINISSEINTLIDPFFITEHRGSIPAKNKGPLSMYQLHRLRPEFCSDTLGIMPNADFYLALKERVGPCCPYTRVHLEKISSTISSCYILK